MDNRSKSKDKYICFELHLVNGLKDSLNAICSYGIVKYSKKFDITLNDIVNTISDVYINPLHFPPIFGSYYEKFIQDNASAQSEVDNHLEASSGDYCIGNYKYSDFHKDCHAITQIHSACHYLGLINVNYRYLLSTYNTFFEATYLFECDHGTDALVMLPKDMALDYINNPKSHREFELLFGFLAIKSLQGNKDYVATNKAAVVQRMLGARNSKVENYFLTSKKTSNGTKKMKEKFTGRYFFDQLITDLVKFNFIKAKITPRGSRKIYLSTKLSMASLATAIIEAKTNNPSTFKDQERLFKNQIANILEN